MLSKQLFTASSVFIAVLVSLTSAHAATDLPAITELKIGDTMPEFELQDYRGKPYSSSDFKSNKSIAVVFMGVECPLVKLYSSRLTKMQQQFGAQLQIIGINSNRHDSVTEIANFANQTGVEFPLLKDPANRVADAFGAQRTPDVFLFDADRKLCYRGSINDQYTYGQQKYEPENMFLSDAITNVLAGKKPSVETTDSVGCIIGRMKEPKSSEVTYANQISRILNERCVNCHRPGEVAPFSLTDYEEVVGWAEMIQEVIEDRRMPPWHANPKHGKFKNDVSLTECNTI